MPFYAGSFNKICSNEKKDNPIPLVSILSRKISNYNNCVWDISAKELLKELGQQDKDLILVQREEGEPICLKVLRFVGFTHKEGDKWWWAPIVIESLDMEKNLVRTFVYLTHRYPSYFANSGPYGPNIWPEAFEAIFCKLIFGGENHGSSRE